MREIADAARIRAFLKALGEAADRPCRVYITGGATAVLYGWRGTTKDVDIKMVPELDSLFLAIPRLKEELHINVELASPDQFIPPAPGWEERSPLVAREGRVEFRHFDLYSQALAKLERGHRQDLEDVRAMLEGNLIAPARLRVAFEEIGPLLFRYPSIDLSSFRRAVEEALR